jgi:hypothetical protein
LATNGLSLTDDGRVFFDSGEPLALRDANARGDVYEWSQDAGRAELISAGVGQFASSLLSVSSDGTDAFFFTRDTLAPGDRNGTLVKLYDAREEGGFFTIPPAPPCAASDECHGPGSPTPPPPQNGTGTGVGGNCAPGCGATPPKCSHGKVRRHGRCVKPKARKKRHGKREKAHR